MDMPSCFTPVPGVSYNQIRWGNPASSVALCTLWGQVEHVKNPNDYYLMGNCYSPRGVGHVVRTILANPQITELHIKGPNLSGTQELLTAAFSRCLLAEEIDTAAGARGPEACPPGQCGYWPPRGTGLSRVPPCEVPPGDASTWLHDELQEVGVLSFTRDGKSHVYPAPINETSEATFRGLPGNRVVGKAIQDVWPLVLAEIMDHGAVSGTNYGNRQKEMLALTWVVERPAEAIAVDLPSWLGFTHAEGAAYAQEHLLDTETPEGVAYTYGNMMRDGAGITKDGFAEHIDQYEKAIALLRASPEQRRVYLTPWSAIASLDAKSPPCLVGLWLRKDSDGTLMMHAVFRSHDMHRAFGKNVYGLCMLLCWFAAKLDMPVGCLVGVSLSAHVYEDCWEEAAAVAKRGRGRMDTDARSAFSISIDRDGGTRICACGALEDADAPSCQPSGHDFTEGSTGCIIAERLSPDGTEVLMRYTGSTAAQVEKLLRRDRVVTTAGHGMYLGIQLAEAEVALQPTSMATPHVCWTGGGVCPDTALIQRLHDAFGNGLPLMVNTRDEIGQEPIDGKPYDIWHTGGPGGPVGSFDTLEVAEAVCAAINALVGT